MSDSNQLDAEKLIQIHKARDEWEANILVGYLDDNNIEATTEGTLQGADSATHTWFGDPDIRCSVFVIEEDAPRATAILKEFQAAVTDPQLLEEAAAQKLKLDKETVTRLRSALKEENSTFDMIGWICVAFLGATALLWAIWPAWLKIAPPSPVMRWMTVALFVLAAIFIARWTKRRMR